MHFSWKTSLKVSLDLLALAWTHKMEIPFCMSFIPCNCMCRNCDSRFFLLSGQLFVLRRISNDLCITFFGHCPRFINSGVQPNRWHIYLGAVCGIRGYCGAEGKHVAAPWGLRRKAVAFIWVSYRIIALQDVFFPLQECVVNLLMEARAILLISLY